MRNKKVDKRIVLTGGGTTGHVSVNLALIPRLLDMGYEIYYIGSKNGIERDLVSVFDQVKYVPISTGKLRRYFSWENFKDVLRVALGSLQAIWQVFKIRPNIAFSKGGFVSVPVLIGTKVNGVPAITHESDLSPGLANKLVQPLVKEVFTTFPETEKYIKSGKGTYLGPVIRDELKNGDLEKARSSMGLDHKPVILVMGGSLGAKKINEVIRQAIPELRDDFNIIHACGKGNFDPAIKDDSYLQFEYISKGLNDILALSDIVVSRSGSNAIFEFLYYKIPMLLVPYSLKASRGDQIENAESFRQKGYAEVLDEDDLSKDDLVETIHKMIENKQTYIDKMSEVNFEDSVVTILDKIEKYKK